MNKKEKIVTLHKNKKSNADKDELLIYSDHVYSLLKDANLCDEIHSSVVNELIVMSISRLSLLSNKAALPSGSDYIKMFCSIKNELNILISKNLDKRNDHSLGISFALSKILECMCRDMMAEKTTAKELNESEKKLQNLIVDRWDSILQFSNYEIVKQYFKTVDGDIIDILAKEKVTGKPVLIELKKHNKTGHKQLRSYAHEFNSPILINVSESTTAKKAKGIIYFTFDDLLK